MISTKSISATIEWSSKSFKQGFAAKLNIPFLAFWIWKLEDVNDIWVHDNESESWIAMQYAWDTFLTDTLNQYKGR